jgi:hypothetical protein
MPRRLTAAMLGALALAACGCGTDASERDARSAVEAFYAAYAAKDGAGACRQLSEDASSALETSEKEPCERAVLSVELKRAPIARTSVWVTSAEVKLANGGAVFLDEIGGRWRIGAAGCSPLPGQPYDCDLEG